MGEAGGGGAPVAVGGAAPFVATAERSCRTRLRPAQPPSRAHFRPTCKVQLTRSFADIMSVLVAAARDASVCYEAALWSRRSDWAPPVRGRLASAIEDENGCQWTMACMTMRA